MEKYNHKEIDTKWQNRWEKDGVYKTSDDTKKPKYYILDMFPYPSGEGLHVGHPKGYIATDILARMKKAQGFNVLHPMGWDAFGLPAENYAIKNKVHPSVAVDKNIATYKRQLGKIGFAYDWDREINTTDPEYYKWTQWAFLQMYKKGLAYQSNEPIIWCPSCQTGLAAEDLENGRCERCESEVERKPMRQWVLKITDYAERLLADLDKLPDWEDSIKEMQRNWIGKSEGASVVFKTTGKSDLEVFTTRPDTLFGCTYCVIAPEHKLIEENKGKIKNLKNIHKYIEKSQKKSDLERTDLNKDKSGVEIEGIMAVNPANGEEVPIFVADYVLPHYGTGAIMAVPAHDQRDWEFAQKHKINMREVVAGAKDVAKEPFVGNGTAVNSDFLNSLKTKEASQKMIEWLEGHKVGQKKTNYKLNDWVFSRQRYWGEPIPIIHCEKCGAVPVPEKELPVVLPDVKHYEPSGTGESPLAKISKWLKVDCPKCKGKAERETNTMPQWAGSSWYYLRYIDPHNKKVLVDKAKEKYWSPVDFYVGGAEHATRHLIYARFWHKFLFDIGVVNYPEPFTKLQHVGLIMAADGRKMSKRWKNVVNPDDVIDRYGADAFRIYEMFMGPFSQSASWNENGLAGARRFLDKVWNLSEKNNGKASSELTSLIHKTIKKVGEDITAFKLNTAISALMILVNKMSEEDVFGKDIFGKNDFETLLKLLSPFAPHLSAELWEKIGNDTSLLEQAWPEYDEKLIVDDKIKLVVQINGKLRDTLDVAADITEEDAKAIALKSEKIKKWLEGKELVKIIFVPGRLINIVIK